VNPPGERAGVTGGRVLLAGMLLWLAAGAVFWPTVASFGDDVGYLGEARLLLEGHLRPSATDVGIWRQGAAKYPLFPSLLLAPLFAVWPRAAFALGVGAALLICWLAGRALESRGEDPVWALLVLAHPSIALISRTATSDVPLCAAMLATWWSFRNDRWWAAVVWSAVLLLIKANGGMIWGALLFGELLRRLPALRRREPAAWAAVRTAGIALVVGVVAVGAANWLTAGKIWFAYEKQSFPTFWPSHFRYTAKFHLLTVLLLPPLLALGAEPFLRRREWGPLAVIFGYGGLMCFYFFVDTGTSWMETMVLSPRLILPAVVFLLIGYAEVLARAARRVTRRLLPVRAALIGGSLVAALAIGVRHVRQQRPAGDAIAAAERVARARAVTELGILPQAEKPGIMFSGRISRADRRAPAQALLLCSSRAASHRAPLSAGELSCDLPGYRAAWQGEGFFVLARD
jgi:hypothetical protein